MMIHTQPVAFRLTLVRFEGDLGTTATGSIWNCNGRRYLVSNWHVLSGRNTYTGQPIHQDGAIPKFLLLHVPKPWPHIHIDPTTTEFKLDLVREHGEPLWSQHEMGQKYDLACVELPKDCEIPENSTLPHTLNNKDIIQIPGIEVFIMGFPEGLVKQGGYPIWKRASIASHPEILSDNLPITLVDTAARPGMSGAPAFIVQYNGQLVTDEKGIHTDFGAKPYKFAGIFSGRYGAEKENRDELSAQLGRLWWEHIVEQMLDNPKPGAWELH